MDQPDGRLAQEVETLEGGGDVGLVGVFTLVVFTFRRISFFEFVLPSNEADSLLMKQIPAKSTQDYLKILLSVSMRH